MGMLVLVVLLIAITFFAITYPGFRKFLIYLGAAVVALGIWYYLYLENEKRIEKEREILARSLISVSDVDFQNLRLSQNYGSWKIAGPIKNNSRYEITALELSVDVSDCDQDGKKCVVVGSDDSVTEYSIEIPPGQARQLDAYVEFADMPALNNWNWNYRVNYIESKKSGE